LELLDELVFHRLDRRLGGFVINRVWIS